MESGLMVANLCAAQAAIEMPRITTAMSKQGIITSILLSNVAFCAFIRSAAP
jgi:hypothetical protein